MIWAFELLVGFWFGYSLVTYLARNTLNIFHRFFAGVPIGIFSFTWVVFITSRWTGLNIMAALPAFIILISASLFLTYQNRKFPISYRTSFTIIQFWTYIIAGIFLVSVMYFAMLRNNKEVKGAAFGDTPFHMIIISSFTHGVNNKRKSMYDIKSLFYENTTLAYPFITNFHTASLMATGRATLRIAMFLSTAFISLSLITGMYTLSLIFSKDHTASALSLLLFFNLGGLCWVNLFDKNRGHMDFVHQWGKNQFEYWFHPLFHVIVPQRASLWSMPLCYWTISILILAIKSLDWKLFLLAGIFVGFTPLVQIHSYVALAQWSIAFAILTFPWSDMKKWTKYIGLWAVFGISANIMALPQIPPYLGRLESNTKEFLKINPIWANKISDYGFASPIICWWRGLGIFAAISLLFGFVNLTEEQIIIYMPSIVVFLIANIVRYQPWEMDNTKVFYAGWIPLALPVVGIFFSKIFKKKILVPIGCILLLSSCLSAFLHTLDCLSSHVEVYSDDEISFGMWMAENIPVNALTVSADHHNHPVSNFGGRMMFEGYGGWVISHGLEWFKHEAMRSHLCGEPDSPEFERHHVTYVISTMLELKAFINITNDGRWIKVYDIRGNAVYALIKDHYNKFD